MNKGFTDINTVLVVAQKKQIFQEKIRELDPSELSCSNAVVNGVRFIYVADAQQARGYDPTTTRFLDLWGAWEKDSLLSLLRSRYSRLSEVEFYAIQGAM